MAFFLKKDKIVQSPFIFSLVAKETRKTTERTSGRKRTKCSSIIEQRSLLSFALSYVDVSTQTD